MLVYHFVQAAANTMEFFLSIMTVDCMDFRYAVPRDQSTNLHPVNKVNKDLHFRGVSALKSPEKLPEMPNRSMTVVGV